MRRRVLVVLIAAVLLVAGFGVAQASIPGPDGTIHGCYKNSNGDLSVVDSTESCPTGYTALNWSGGGGTGSTGYEVIGGTVVEGVPLTLSCPTGKFAVETYVQSQFFGGSPHPRPALGTYLLDSSGRVTGVTFRPETGFNYEADIICLNG
jgi:hypothetical protein